MFLYKRTYVKSVVAARMGWGGGEGRMINGRGAVSTRNEWLLFGNGGPGYASDSIDGIYFRARTVGKTKFDE